MMNSSEPTRSRRAKVEQNLVFKPKRQNNSVGHLSNVSISGAFFVTTEKVIIGSELILYLPVQMISKKSLCIVSGKVVRVEKQGDLFGYGVCFRETLTVNQRNMLENFVEFKLTGKIAERTDPENRAPKARPQRQTSVPEKKAPERRQHSRVIRDQRLQRTRTARLQLEKQKSWSAREAMDRANQILVSLAIAITLLVGGAFFGWKTVKSMSVNSAVGEILPLEESHISEGVYFGELQEMWIATTSDREKAYVLEEVAERLQRKGFEGAIFTDEHRIPVAKIVRNNSTKGLEVRLEL